MLAPNTLLQNRYLIVRSIGQGGMGTVYLAKDQRLGNTVALKETFFSDALLRRAFQREARLLAHLRHPALPKVIDHFDEGDGQFLVMEFIPGDDLEILLAHRGYPFPPDQVLKWADQLLDALDYLHSQEIPVLHRDIKPANLKLTSRDQIILLDFGLAKGAAGQITSVAASRSVLGFTPNFAALEQIQGAGTGPRSDLYSLGATLYYLMTGMVPPDSLSRATASVSDQPDPLRQANELNPQITHAVGAILKQAMSLNPNHRPSSADEMRQMLREASQVQASLNRSDPAPTVLPQKMTPPLATQKASIPTTTIASSPPQIVYGPANKPSPPLRPLQSNFRVLIPGILISLILVAIVGIVAYDNSSAPDANSNSPNVNSNASPTPTEFSAIAGKVTNSLGAGIPGVFVTLTQPGFLTRITTTTNAEGEYYFQGLAPGEYKVETYKPNYSRPTARTLRIGRGATATLDIQLRPEDLVLSP